MIRIQHFFDKATATLTYVVWDPATKDAVVIDPVLDYDPAASKVTETSVTALASFLEVEKMTLHFILETHAHADHLSGSQALKRRFPNALVAIGAKISEVQSLFKDVFDMGDSFKTDGSQFDRLFADEESFAAGSLRFKVLYTPGHTPACACYLIEDAVFTGDTLFMPDLGVGRCDFPGGSVESMYESVTRKLYTLPDAIRVFVGHDYPPAGRDMQFESTIGEHKKANVQLSQTTSKETFVHFRTERDKTLSAPKLLLPSVQVNINAGQLPSARTNGRSYLNIPISK